MVWFIAVFVFRRGYARGWADYAARLAEVEAERERERMRPERDIRRAAFQCRRDDAELPGFVGGGVWHDWMQKIDELRERLSPDSSARSKSIDELADEYERDPRWSR